MEPPGYHVVLEPDAEAGYVAVVPAFPGCSSHGETVEAALTNAREAILMTIGDMRERGDAIPDPASELVHRIAVGHPGNARQLLTVLDQAELKRASARLDSRREYVGGGVHRGIGTTSNASRAPAFVIGSETGEHVSVRVTRREFPDALDYWDGNWNRATVHIRVGAFHAEYEALFRSNEFASFKTELATLHATLKGRATFDTMEHWLRIDVEGDGRGHFVASCEACERPGSGNTLRFELAFDQTQLPPVLSALKSVLEAFPVRGRLRD